MAEDNFRWKWLTWLVIAVKQKSHSVLAVDVGPKREHTLHKLKKKNPLAPTVSFRIKFKILLLIYKALNGLGPIYLLHLLYFYEQYLQAFWWWFLIIT